MWQHVPGHADLHLLTLVELTNLMIIGALYDLGMHCSDHTYISELHDQVSLTNKATMS